jgi:hypothetical protein
MADNNSVRMVLVGAGNRGMGIFGQYALDMPHRAKYVAVVEPDKKKRKTFAEKHEIPESMQFERSESFFVKTDKIADAMVIATLETERLDIVLGAIDKGYHILIEKPLGCTLEDVVKLTDAAKEFDGIFIVCHQMRHIAGYSVVKSLIDSGRFGDVITMQHSESVSWHHMAHSFVRGVFNNDSMTPMILAKSCHDMDIMRYLIGKPPVRVSSFGGLSYFKKEKAPEGAPAFCLDGCPAYNDCPYHVLKIYFGDDVDPAYARTMGVINSTQELFESLKSSRFGRCVFQCDNNVVDHQVVDIEFEEGVTASFQMAGHNYLDRRITKISMTNGEIGFDFNEGVVKAYTFSPVAEEIIKPAGMAGNHMGGDRVIMDSFVDAVRTGDKSYVLTPVQMSLDSHLMAFAAEKSRIEKRIIKIEELSKICS